MKYIICQGILLDFGTSKMYIGTNFRSIIYKVKINEKNDGAENALQAE